jgi:hypothetical protein
MHGLYLNDASWLDTAGKFLITALHVTPQNDQLMSECCILWFMLALRLEWRGQDGQYET